MPFRIAMQAKCAHSLELLKQNAAANEGVPRVKVKRRLAVVGGGPLLVNSLDDLRAWDGDIWAINHTADWLLEQGIVSTLLCIEVGYVPWRTQRRIMASSCDPRMVTSETVMFDMIETHGHGLAGGHSAATRAPNLAIALGYNDIHFFGCEGSFTGAADHVDRDVSPKRLFVIRAGGNDYKVEPQMLIQCQEFVELFATYGDVFTCRSGGLLQAMIDNPDSWEVVAVSAELKAHLEEVNGKSGLYEGNEWYPGPQMDPVRETAVR